jgi:hypothetical protein
VRKKLEKISNTLGGILKARGLQARLSEYRILGKWEESVGKVIARHARPVSLHGRKLFLAVDSSAWMQQLSLLRPEIIEKVNRVLGRNSITEIALNLGEIPQSAGTPARTGPGIRVDLSAEDRGKIEAHLEQIRDADVRAAVRRVIEKDFLSKKEKRGN